MKRRLVESSNIETSFRASRRHSERLRQYVVAAKLPAVAPNSVSSWYRMRLRFGPLPSALDHLSKERLSSAGPVKVEHFFPMNVQPNTTKRQSFLVPPSPGAPRLLMPCVHTVLESIDATKGKQDLEMLSKGKVREVEDLLQALSDVSRELNRQRASCRRCQACEERVDGQHVVFSDGSFQWKDFELLPSWVDRGLGSVDFGQTSKSACTC